MQAYGLAGKSKVAKGKWRNGKASGAQLRALKNMRGFSRYLPAPHNKTARWACDAREHLRRGSCSDLIDVLKVLANQSELSRNGKRHWKWPEHVHVPELITEDL